VAVWWPERRILLVGDALGTIPFFRAGAEPAGLHPVLRLRPPRSLRGLEPEHLLVGHGEGIHHDPPALESALRTGRRQIPRWLLGLPRAVREGY
jgi:glyoxylase-like metal-dependent hydrolase (beta-lactamase superfamily II)